MRLIGNEKVQWQGRAHFFGAAAEAIRRILIDNARRKRALRHGGGRQRFDIEEIELAAPVLEQELPAIDEALERFAAAHKQKAELVKLRYFAGLTIQDSAKILGISVPTAKRWWTYARAWLYRQVEYDSSVGKNEVTG